VNCGFSCKTAKRYHRLNCRYCKFFLSCTSKKITLLENPPYIFFCYPCVWYNLLLCGLVVSPSGHWDTRTHLHQKPSLYCFVCRNIADLHSFVHMQGLALSSTRQREQVAKRRREQDTQSQRHTD
jgi:hypothetical protein